MDRIILEKEAKTITGLSKSTRLRLEKNGKFPRRFKLSKNRIGWKLSEIRQWIEELKF
ncbi:MAG TPA: AlpA family phage regulatory protein [Oligoflexia bacterium]|nr:AlpA family phage regulatory protein [Oligoflexia bacterium]HMP49289.1 AlpA family phage regulatory protein [Oligoflexia bacterium]